MLPVIIPRRGNIEAFYEMVLVVQKGLNGEAEGYNIEELYEMMFFLNIGLDEEADNLIASIIFLVLRLTYRLTNLE